MWGVLLCSSDNILLYSSRHDFSQPDGSRLDFQISRGYSVCQDSLGQCCKDRQTRRQQEFQTLLP